MELYLVRHAAAVRKDVAPDRPLSETGRRQAQAMARFLRSVRVQVDAIWHSNKTRARETAETIAQAIEPHSGLLELDGLTPNASVTPWIERVDALGEPVMIVGHLPFLGVLASSLLTGEAGHDFVRFEEAAGVRLLRDGFGHWDLMWQVWPALLG